MCFSKTTPGYCSYCYKMRRRQRSFRPLFLTLLPGVMLLLLLQAIPAQTVEKNWADTAMANICILEAGDLFNKDKHQEALENARQAFDIYVRLYDLDHIKTARARLYVAREYRMLNRENEAIPLIQQSLRVYEAARDTYFVSLCYNQLSLCYSRQYHFEEAGKSVRLAIEILRPDSSKRASVMAKFYVTLGSLYNAEKKYLQAIPILESAQLVFVQLGDIRTTAEVSYHIGNAYYGLHDFARAKEHYLSAFANLQNQLNPEHSYFADLYVKFGYCCQKTGEPETGLRYMLEAKEAYLKAGADNLNYIQFMFYLGQFYLDGQQYPQAVEQLELCLAAKEKQYGAGSPRLIATIQVLSEAYFYVGQFGLTEAGYRRGMKIVTDSLGGNDKLLYRFYIKLAGAQFAQGYYGRSLILCDSAFVMAGFNPDHPEKMIPRDYFRELCQLYARSLFEQFRQTADSALLVRAEKFFALAAETLYREVEEISVHSSREILYDRDFTVLEQWLDARMALYNMTGHAEHLEAAFQIAGHGKAFLLAKAMRQSGALRYAGVPDSILQAESSLREKIVSAEKILDTSSREKGNQMDSVVLLLSRELSSWRTDYDALLRTIEKSYPEYYRLRILRDDIPSAELRAKWLASNQGLLMYSLTQAHLYIFVLKRDTFCVKTLPLDASLNADLEQFRKCLTEYFVTADPADNLYDVNLEKYIDLAQSLYRKLVLPVDAILPERVVIIPEGKLWHLPFEALLPEAPAIRGNLRQYPFWTCKKAISYALSTSFLIDTATVEASKPLKDWLGLAPFAIQTADDGFVSRAGQHEGFLPLPFSGKEINDIAGLLQGEAWLGAEASPGRFGSEAGRYRILHLATHGHSDDRLGDYSYLAVSRSEKPLPAKDLYQMSLSASMVVVSACESGSGKLLRGEGIIGLVRAFTYAGARSTVASLWVAHDQSTANLMVDFYRNLLRGEPKDVALKNARLTLLKKAPAEVHPFYWAGFRVYGSTAPLWPVR